jgi:hypothetical protein
MSTLFGIWDPLSTYGFAYRPRIAAAFWIGCAGRLETDTSSNASTARFIDDEFTSMITKAFELMFLGFLIAIPSYWISGADFLAISGIFYISQLGLLY